MIPKKNYLRELKNSISKEVRIIREINSFFNNFEKHSAEEKEMIHSHTNSLKNLLKRENNNIPKILNKISLIKPLHSKIKNKQKILNKDYPLPFKKKKKNFIEEFIQKRSFNKKFPLEKSEKKTLKRIGKKGKDITKKKDKKPNKYVSTSTKIFSNFSAFLINKGMFKSLSKNLIKTNLELLPKSYVSVILFTTLLSFIAGIFIFLFFLFFNFQVLFPFITIANEPLGIRFLKIFWILFIIPIASFLFMYIYPSLEKSSLEGRINQELPFATINMAAISGSIVNPTKIFSIISSTKEYVNLEKEFIKVINGVNVLGYDLITTLKNRSFNSPSKKLADLFNGIATTVKSGGDLPKFFDERAKSLLFEYNLEKEKSTRAAETFMDIYISVVIATPMILMLLLIMMQISGLGIALSTSMITLMMILGVSIINIIFLTFLHIRQSNE
tara:strand:+ start:320 stop:1648 length:1329 start_codon:yes stop_codon:yes gene_type:complete